MSEPMSFEEEVNEILMDMSDSILSAGKLSAKTLYTYGTIILAAHRQEMERVIGKDTGVQYDGSRSLDELRAEQRQRAGIED